MEKLKVVTDFVFLGSKVTAGGDCSHEIKTLAPWKESYNKARQQRHHFADKSSFSLSYGFSFSHVLMWELDHDEGWALNNWCFWMWCSTKLLRVPWTARGSNQSILKYQPWIFTEKTDAEVEAAVLRPPDANSWLSDKNLMLGKIEGKRRREWQRMRW